MNIASGGGSARSILFTVIALILIFGFLVFTRRKQGAATPATEGAVGKSMVFYGFAGALILLAIEYFLLIFFFEKMFMEYNLLMKVYSFAGRANSVAMLIAAVGFGSLYKANKNVLDIAAAAGCFVPVILSFSYDFFGLATSGFGVFVVGVLSASYLAIWALKFFFKGNLFVTAVLGGAFLVEVFGSYVFRKGIMGFNIASLFTAAVYLVCAAAPVFAALCEDGAPAEEQQ